MSRHDTGLHVTRLATQTALAHPNEAPTTELDVLLDAKDRETGGHTIAPPGGRTVQLVHEDEVGYQVEEEPQALEERIRERAYFRAEARGFEPGYEVDDWLWAERDVQQR